MSDEQDSDRAAILARRQRFIAMAIAGLSGLASGSVLSSEASARCVLPGDHLPPLPAPVLPPETMSEAERVEQAKLRYEEGARARADRDFVQALVAFEAAYYLTPGKHELAFVIGETAYEAGRLAMAREYLLHFVTYVDSSEADRIHEAQLLLFEIGLGECETSPLESPLDERFANPQPCLKFSRPTLRERRRAHRAERREQRRARRRSE